MVLRHSSLLAWLIVLSCCASTSAQVVGGWRPMPAAWHPSTANNASSCMTFDSLRGESVLVNSYSQATWVFGWSGTRWRTISDGATSPVLDRVRSVVHDPVRDRLVVVDYPGHVHEWDGTAWHAGTPTPFGSRELDLAFDPVRARTFTVVDDGIWDWDGQRWTHLPGSDTGQVFPYARGIQIAYDAARGVVVASGATQASGSQTIEWDGSAWRRFHQGPATDLVYAPWLGGVVKYDAASASLKLWNPAAGWWEELVVRSQPSTRAETAITGDPVRQRLVLTVPDPTDPTWELDPSYVAPRRTWLVDTAGNGDFRRIIDAMRQASIGDRILVRAGDYRREVPMTMPRAMDIECDPGTQLPERFTVPARAYAAHVRITGGTVGNLLIDGDASIHGMQIREGLRTANQARVRLERCTITGSRGGLQETAAFALEGSHVVFDECTLTGLAGFWPDPFTYVEPTSALSLTDAARAVISHSTLRAGDGLRQVLGFPGFPAIESRSTRECLVFGGSTLVAGVSPNSGPGVPATGAVAVTNDTTWTGTGSPSRRLADLSWLSAPDSAAIGQPLTIRGTIQSGHVVALFLSDRVDHVDLPWSEVPLMLDASTAWPVATLTSTLPDFILTVPHRPELVGYAAHWQGVSMGSTLGAEFTNARTVHLR